MEHLLSSFISLYPDFISILSAANPAIIVSIFLPWTTEFGKGERLRFVHKSIFIALMIAICFTFIVQMVIAMASIVTRIFPLVGGVVLFCIAIHAMLRKRKKGKGHWCSSALVFASPVVTGPAIFATTLNSVARNGSLKTSALLISVMIIVWLTLVMTTISMSRRGRKWMTWLERHSRLAYAPLTILSVWIIVQGILGLFA